MAWDSFIIGIPGSYALLVLLVLLVFLVHRLQVIAVVADIFLRIFLDSFFGCHRHVLVAEAGREEEGVQTVFQPYIK